MDKTCIQYAFILALFILLSLLIFSGIIFNVISLCYAMFMALKFSKTKSDKAICFLNTVFRVFAIINFVKSFYDNESTLCRITRYLNQCDS